MRRRGQSASIAIVFIALMFISGFTAFYNQIGAFRQELKIKEDIQREMKIKSWRGVRHSLGLKVRGQRTRTTGRKGGPVGVARRAVAEAGGSKESKQ